MNGRPLKIGWNLPGTFTRLGLHMGAIAAWVRSGLPLPSLVVATSAGAIIAACCISFEEDVLHRVARIVGNLRKQQIFRLSSGIWYTVYHLLAVPTVLIICAAIAKSSDQWWSWLFLLGGLGLCVWLFRRAGRTFLKTESPFDNTPLRELLLENLSFPGLFQAKAELEVIAADVATPKSCVFSNHEAWKTDPQNRLHRERFVDAILGSAALPGRFPLRSVDGVILRDAEVWTDYPVHRFRDRADIIFRFDYWEPLQPSHAPRHWLRDLLRCFDVMRDRNTLEKMRSYEAQRKEDGTLPRVVHLRASETLLRKIPELVVYDFKPGVLWRSIRLGYRIIRENLPMIRRELGIE